MKIDTLSDIGTTRKDNQDNYWSAVMSVDGSEVGVVCVCDGMGGLNNGGIASRMVVEAVRDYLVSDYDFDGLHGVVESVNKAVHEYGSGENLAMGTTCTVLVCTDGTYKVLHVGDSRCYQIRNKQFKQITEDHSALKKYNISKSESPELWSKYKNSLTRCVGVKDSVMLDSYTGSYKSGDRFLVCSDGLWHYLEDSGYSVNTDKLDCLISDCKGSGETDNITACVLNV